MPFFRKDNIEINYIKEGEGEPLVLVNGYCCKLESWNFQISFFKQKMTVIALDLRGVGKSSRPNEPYTLDTLVEDIKDLLEYLEVQEQIHLCGFNNGGCIVQKFVLKYPLLVKTILLFESGPYVPPLTYEEFLKFLEKTVKNATPEKIIQIMLPKMFSLAFRKKLKKDKDLFALYKNDMGLIAQLKDPPRYQDYINHWMTIKDFDTRELLHEITQPTLILLVFQNDKERGEIKEIEPTLDKIPNLTIKLLEGISHGLIIEAPEIVNNLMWNFLKEYLTTSI
ncbi:MAG: alpha/beta fold hydrolase [Candidatus Thorarchaeota archaeon]